MHSFATMVAAFAVSFFLQHAFRLLSRRGMRHRQQTYLLSGSAITLAILASLWLHSGSRTEAGALLGVLALAFCAGALADILHLPRWVQIAAGLGLAWYATSQGFVIHEFKPPFFSDLVNLGHWATPLTVIWISAVAYAVILCRRLPGLAGGIVSISALAFFAVTEIVFAAPNPLVAPLACALAGAALGTFPHDIPYRSAPPEAIAVADARARLLPRMLSPLAQGGAGHWVLGFALAILSVVGFLKNTAFLLLAAPLLLLGVPFVEATYAFVYGSHNRRFSFSLGRRRELLHEALLRGGLSPRRCVWVFLAITGYFSLIAILLAVMVKITFLLKLVIAGVLSISGLVGFICMARILSRRPPAPQTSEKIAFFDVPVTVVDMEGALQRIETYVQARTPHMVATTDSSAIVKAHHDEELAAILKTADLVTPDGTGVVWMARVLGLPIEQRVSGVDMVDRICALAADRGWGIYLLGAEPGVTDVAAAKLVKKHPGLQVVGCMHGYYTAEEEPEIIARIAALQPEVLFVAFGIPKQEKWIARNLQTLGVPVCIGVGGSFDVISGRLKRAPRWMQVTGTEWLYRTIQQPKRLPRLVALPRLVFMTLREVFLKRR